MDLIERQKAIDVCNRVIDVFAGHFGAGVLVAVRDEISDLPSAQPDSKETSYTHKALDTISRQAAIDAILAVTGNSSVRELYEHVQEHGLSDMWSGGVNAAIDIIIAVPSAQSEPLDEWCTDCKEYDHKRHCCPRWNRVIRTTLKDMKEEQPEPSMEECACCVLSKPQQRWIPVSERLPKEDTDVLVTYVNGEETRIAPVNYGHSTWYDCVFETTLDPLKVTAWMPLPEPYKTDRNVKEDE